MLTKAAIESLPRPCPDPELYQSTLEAGFKKYPERKENYLKYKAAVRDAKLDYLPVKLDIENVSCCNFHCTMCVVSDWPGLKRAEDMSLQDYQALLDEQYGVIEIKLQGIGEPLMGKCYFEMIEFAREKHIWVRSITNGSLLHLKDNFKRVIDADICELQISIDGATPETYQKIRRGGRFDRTRENCVLINDYGARIGRKRTRLWTLAQRDNFHELEDMVRLAAECGFERQTFALDVEDWGQARWNEINAKVDMHDDFDERYAHRLIELGTTMGVEVTFWATYEKFSTNDRERLCPWPFERAVVSSDIRIVPCCMIGNPDVYDLGDAHRFSQAWNSKTYQEFRQDHLDGRLPGVCKNCYLKGQT